MEIRHHRILGGIPKLESQGPTLKSKGAELEAYPDRFEWSGASESPSYPDISGLAKFSRARSVAVRDSKLESSDKRLMLLHHQSGEVENLETDWSKTGRARDLEALTPRSQRGSYLAVEASSFQEHKARLFELKVTAQGGEAQRSHVLPEFGQEIEGLVSVPQKNGTEKVLFGGRGDENGVGRVYWGTLDEKGLHFTQEGLKGQEVDGPPLGEGRRSISDMVLDKEGKLWASAATDNGDDGPFQSAVYQVGRLAESGSKALTLKSDGSHATIPGTKAEALILTSDGSFLMGSDNETRGGRLETFGLA